jgi:hypothetical protein
MFLASYQYHELGLLSEKSLAHKNSRQSTRFTCDALFRLERIIDANEHWIQFCYTYESGAFNFLREKRVLWN